MRSRLLIILVAALFLGHYARAAEYGSGDLTRADIRFFFDSVKLDGSKWIYHLSPNTHGMLWRIIDGTSDRTGACQAGDSLTVIPNAHLELKSKGIDLNIFPYGSLHRVVLRMAAVSELGAPTEERDALISADSNGHWGLLHARF
jgi:hypothetical protein